VPVFLSVRRSEIGDQGGLDRASGENNSVDFSAVLLIIG